ncbi:MAG: hypothetical protein DRJ49_03245 [Thermoprotei archaeon]|nr:MAG: hypothetical protein DRN53_00275 [Thermoprotei archaeon]RLE89372.1 MAG: hypothetical protein DRJ49_03245 [Thermoprotei archaeon]
MPSKALVVIGRKHVNKYISTCIVLLHSGVDKLDIRARGQHIPKAIEVVEKLRKHYVIDLKVEDIRISSDMVAHHNEGLRRVSTIRILLSRGDQHG